MGAIGEMNLVFAFFLQAGKIGNLAAFSGERIGTSSTEAAPEYRVAFGQIEHKKTGVGSAGGDYGYFGGSGVKADLVEVDGRGLSQKCLTV